MSVSWSRKCYRRMVNLKTPSGLFHTLVLSNSTFISLKVARSISFPSCKPSIRQPPLVMSDNLTTKIFRLRTYTCMHALYTIRAPLYPKPTFLERLPLHWNIRGTSSASSSKPVARGCHVTQGDTSERSNRRTNRTRACSRSRFSKSGLAALIQLTG
jgi:hypothetical protein